jgi:hypothetical protein
MEIKCKFKQQNDVVERGTFKSRKVWVIDDENADYPQTIEVEVAQDKVNLFNNFRPGQPLTVSINLRGREWTNPQGEVKVFNTLQCWKVTSDVADDEMNGSMIQKIVAKFSDPSRPEQGKNAPTRLIDEEFNKLHDMPFSKPEKTKKAGNIEKNFQNEFIQEITNDNNDLPF